MTDQTKIEAPRIPPPVSIPGIQIGSTGDILGPESRLCVLLWAPSGYGKTHLAGSLDDLTVKYRGKRTLYIPVEPAEGGGAATIRQRDIPSWQPKDYSDFYRMLGLLRNDKSVGGVVLDNASEFAKQFVKPAALKYPSRENTPTRSAGIATRSDYQVMGELMSQTLRALIALTTHPDPAYRKDLIVTAADLTREEDEKIVFVGPDLPGRMSREAAQMFQQVGTIQIKPSQVDGKRVLTRSLTFAADGVKSLKDRYDIYPAEIPLRKDPSQPGHDLLTLFETWWLPATKRAAA